VKQVAQVARTAGQKLERFQHMLGQRALKDLSDHVFTVGPAGAFAFSAASRFANIRE